MNFQEAFHETVNRFGLNAGDLALKSGMTKPQLSQFRHGRNIRTDTFERLLRSMPLEAQEYCLGLWLGKNRNRLEELVQQFAAESSEENSEADG